MLRTIAVTTQSTSLGFAFTAAADRTTEDLRVPSVEGDIDTLRTVEQWLRDCPVDAITYRYFVDGHPVLETDANLHEFGRLTEAVPMTGSLTVPVGERDHPPAEYNFSG